MIKKFIKLILQRTYHFRNRYNLTATKNRFILKIKNKIHSNKIINKHIDQSSYILIYCPIEYGGLTIQLDQIAEILIKKKINFKISWHVSPTNLDSQHVKKFIKINELNNYKKPKLIIYFERFPLLDKFIMVPSIFYINIDWLDKQSLINSINYADIVAYPIDYKEKTFKSLFRYSFFNKLFWPPNFILKYDKLRKFDQNKLNILYIGKFNENSRKNPNILMSSLKKYKFINLNFIIKSIDYLENIKSENNVKILNGFMTNEKIRLLYEESHIALLCNSSEGNGLTIIEAIEAGCVPVIIDGEPMNSIIPDDCCFKIKRHSFERKKFAKSYFIDEKSLSTTLAKITFQNYLKKYENLIKFKKSEIYKKRHNFENNFLDLLEIYMPDKKNVGKLNSNQTKLINNKIHEIEVYITTSNRFNFFKKSFESIYSAIKKSKHKISINVIIDGHGKDTNNYLNYLSNYQASIIYHDTSLGLPYTMKFIKFHLKNKYIRLCKSLSGFVCYLQDDCIINDNFNYFDDMVEINYSTLEYDKLGMTSGFKNKIHPGYENIKKNGKNLTLSNTIDGKNLFTFTKKFLQMGEHKFYNNDYKKLGNPGPNRGSQFDIFIWKEDVYFKDKINVILDNSISLIKESKEKENSTWNNSETDDQINDRVKDGRIYR